MNIVELSRRVRLGTRLSGAFGLLAMLLVIVGVVGLRSNLTQATDGEQVAEALALSADAGTAKFRTADFNGWQTAYAYDVSRGVPNATSDTAQSRKAFLAAAAPSRADLARLKGHPLTADRPFGGLNGERPPSRDFMVRSTTRPSRSTDAATETARAAADA